MKKTFFYAICVMVLATMVAVVSCKKDDQTTPTDNPNRPAKEFCPPSVSDMNAYLGDFKSKMRNPDRDGGATMSLEEAAWHLSSVANYDFANANVEFTDIRFDTLYGHVNVTDGEVSMADLGAVYAEMSAAIDGFYHSLDLDNKHFRFIGAEISENGEVMMRTTTTYNRLEHLWYFNSSSEASAVCQIYFNPYEYYYFEGNFDTQLLLALNSIQSLAYVPIHERMYYVYTKTENPQLLDHLDEHSPFPHYTRIFCTYFPNQVISYDKIEYCLDSYLGLGVQLQGDNEHVIEWDLLYPSGYVYVGHDKLATYYHRPSIKYGMIVVNSNHNDY